MDDKLKEWLDERTFTKEREDHFLESLVSEERREEYLSLKESHKMIIRYIWSHGYTTALQNTKEK